MRFASGCWVSVTTIRSNIFCGVVLPTSKASKVSFSGMIFKSSSLIFIVSPTESTKAFSWLYIVSEVKKTSKVMRFFIPKHNKKTASVGGSCFNIVSFVPAGLFSSAVSSPLSVPSACRACPVFWLRPVASRPQSYGFWSWQSRQGSVWPLQGPGPC